MAIKKIQMKPEGANDYGDILYPETGADMVKTSVGTNVESELAKKANKQIKDDTTTKKYELGINNGLLYYREVI